MKRIILCCDGTWNNEDSGDDFTNVARIAWAILPNDTRGKQPISQIVYYHSGVGTGDIVDKIAGGAVGMGLARAVRDSYSFLASNYCDGDEIFLLGFSRGAYTARSIGGLIGWAGLLHKRDMDHFAALWESYRLRSDPGREDVRKYFPNRHQNVPVQCIGVWDTVGALGIPGNLDQLFTKFYQFHDTTLGPHVRHAYHALALDERRVDFTPTLWTLPAGPAAGQTLEQMWFAGAHSNVGGGYDEHGLSDITLAWMASKLDKLLAIDFDQLAAKQDRRSLWGLARLHNSFTGAWQLRGSRDRKPSPGNPATHEAIHPSVAVRLAKDAACEPRPYVSTALAGIAAPAAAALSAVEQNLRWTATRAASTDTPPRPNLLNKVLRLFGGG